MKMGLTDKRRTRFRCGRSLWSALRSTDALHAQADAPKGVRVRLAWEWTLEREEAK
jgi:hypothetical protein